MKFILAIIFVASLSGCATTIFDNRIACTLAKDKAFFVSEYGQIGIASTIADTDRAVICK